MIRFRIGGVADSTGERKKRDCPAKSDKKLAIENSAEQFVTSHNKRTYGIYNGKAAFSEGTNKSKISVL